MRVAAKLGIAFSTVDYEKEYRERVFAPFIEGLNRGINPNPDVLCNPLVKFVALSAIADEIGAAWIATGHYARKIIGDEDADSWSEDCSSEGPNSRCPASSAAHEDASEKPIFSLACGIDKEKDQSYFLSRITQEQLARTIFPLGEMTKPQVRELARKIGLHVADKEGTSGLCFIGERNFEKFMTGRVKAKPGPVVLPDGKVIGEHRGLPFYSIGQRHGFGYISIPSATLRAAGSPAGGEPYYVAEKRLADNALVVAPAYDPSLMHEECVGIEPHWISGEPSLPMDCDVRLRYRQALQSCRVESRGDSLGIVFEKPQKAVTPGQYAAFYDGEICLGSAIISR